MTDKPHDQSTTDERANSLDNNNLKSMGCKNSTTVGAEVRSQRFLMALFSSIAIFFSPKICPTMALNEVLAALVAVCGMYLGANTVGNWRASNIEKDKKSP